MLLVIEGRAIELEWTFFGPLFEAMVTAMQEFDKPELAAATAFLARMNDVIATSRSVGTHCT